MAKTPSCVKVWSAIDEVEAILTAVGAHNATIRRLADAFVDFECGWDEHCKEFHNEEECACCEGEREE